MGSSDENIFLDQPLVFFLRNGFCKRTVMPKKIKGRTYLTQDDGPHKGPLPPPESCMEKGSPEGCGNSGKMRFDKKKHRVQISMPGSDMAAGCSYSLKGSSLEVDCPTTIQKATFMVSKHCSQMTKGGNTFKYSKPAKDR